MTSRAPEETVTGVDAAPGDAHLHSRRVIYRERVDRSDAAEFVVEVCVAVSPQYANDFNTTQDLVTYLATSLNAVALWFGDMNDTFIGFQLNAIINMEEGDTEGRNICGLTSYELSKQNACVVNIIDVLYATINMTNSCHFPKCDLTLKLSRLGASHDGENRTLGIDGYPEALECSWNEGYLMSFGGVGDNMHRLSKCSKAQIKFVVSVNGYEQCKIRCCWESPIVIPEGQDDLDGSGGIMVYFGDYDGDYTDDYVYTTPRQCEEHSMPEAMSCGENKCTNYDVEYKILALTAALNASVAATLPEEDRNESFAVTEFIVRWCSNGYALPRQLYNYTCEEYLAMLTVTCDAPVTVSAPDVNGLGQPGINSITNVNTGRNRHAAALSSEQECAYLSPCVTITLPDFLTADTENDTDKVLELVNCSNYDIEYKVQALMVVLNESVAATLPEGQRNESLSVAEYIVRWCSYGLALPRDRFNYTCEEYLAMVNVTCDTPVDLSVPDVNGLNRWQTFLDLINLSSAASCPKPSAVEVIDIGHDYVTFGWNSTE
ncbi:hypothetical protein HPB50_005946 [Hyalomma asiaticum]|uniref:Uncharacterized protein n=1 Tax=Hyalomma asiaticum TaxID=266040 RepID=A0ACB7RS85_HYAAI|nr:hypothetical protein HPB50_005946 [Hyalomma asiaticum]